MVVARSLELAKAAAGGGTPDSYACEAVEMLSALERDISCTGWGWQVGHPWVGERVRHVFPPQRARGKRRGLGCTVTCWLPPCGGRPALWRVESGSGECEDLEEGVLATALAQQGERGGTGDRLEAFQLRAAIEGSAKAGDLAGT